MDTDFVLVVTIENFTNSKIIDVDVHDVNILSTIFPADGSTMED